MKFKELYGEVARRLRETHAEDVRAMSTATQVEQLADMDLANKIGKHPWTRKKLKEAGYAHDPTRFTWRRIKAAPDSPKQQKKNQRKNLRRKLHKQKKLKKP